MKRIISIFTIALLGGVGALSVDHFINHNQTFIRAGLPLNYQVQNSSPAKFASFNGMVPENVSGDFVKASEISLPAVVHVRTEYAPKGNQFYYYDPFGWGVPQQQPHAQMGSGSGVIISGD